MKKVLFIHRYGIEWECSIHLVDDRIANRALSLFRERMWDLAYRVIAQNNLATDEQRLEDDWNSLDTIDIVLAYFQKRR
jgi:hypothetical protein